MMAAIVADKKFFELNGYSYSLRLIARARLNSETSADSWNFYNYTVSTTPVSIVEVFPSVASVTTLAPVVGFRPSTYVEMDTLSFVFDGTDARSAYKALVPYVKSGISPYPNLPPVLGNGTAHSVQVDFADRACYKATGTWTFTVNQVLDATPPTVTFVDPPRVSGLRGGGFLINIDDPDSGVDYRTIEIWLDAVPWRDSGGKSGADFINASYDPISGNIFSWIAPGLSVGEHRFRVKVGNFSLGGPVMQDLTLSFEVVP